MRRPSDPRRESGGSSRSARRSPVSHARERAAAAAHQAFVAGALEPMPEPLRARIVADALVRLASRRTPPLHPLEP